MLELLLRGASPAAACQQLGLSPFAWIRTLDDSEPLRHRTAAVQQLLTGNVLAAAYRAAMQGAASIQSLWLKTFNTRPAEEAPAATPHTFDDYFDRLSRNELFQLARAMGVDVPPELDATPAPAGQRPQPPGLS
ncbi:MAG: hypothetical protein KDA79_16470 [Planctomycetaceae bacterium]|nr:hypothetical protein [Planctomycetaceae bacterium]